VVEYDKELLSAFYKSRGFAKFQVISSVADISVNRDNFYLTFTLDEGKRYRFNDAEITSNLTNVDGEDFKRLVAHKHSQVFNIRQVDKTIQNITNELNDMGYAFVIIEPIITFKEDEGENGSDLLDVRYVISEGRKIYLDKINIYGNLKTYDNVVRRQFRIEEGDPFNARKIMESEHRIRDLDYFDTVSVEQKSTEDSDKFDLDVILEEKSTAALNFAGGYNTVDGPMGMISFSETNLFGRGQYLNLNFMKSSKKSDFDISFVEPYFMDEQVSLGADIFNRSSHIDYSHYRSFSDESKGFTLKTSYKLLEKLTHSIRYSFLNRNISDVASGASILIKEQQGKTNTSAIGHRFTYDVRDSVLNPTSGYFVLLDQQLAGVGGDIKYFRNEVMSALYIPVFDTENIIEIGGGLGHIEGIGNSNVRIADRFFIGGEDFRGFKFRGVGPRAKMQNADGSYSNSNYQGDSLGGNTYYSLSAEMKVPLNFSKELGFFGVVFTEMGEVFNLEINDSDKDKVFDDRGMRLSTGVGIGFNTPMGWPVKINYAIPLAKKHFDRTGKFFITFQTSKFL
jgi:outer membrane protein insertion porin family